MAVLSRKYHVNAAIEPQGPDHAQCVAPAHMQQPNLEPAIQLAAAMGTEIAKSINEGLKGMLSCMPAGSVTDDEKECIAKTVGKWKSSS